jgi:ABC-2 type transport system ATP-binding protein
VTVLMSSHQLELVEQLCPRVAILERGRLLGFGSPDELRARFGREGPLESLLVEVLGGARRGELSWL